jgi:hypothetical protein
MGVACARTGCRSVLGDRTTSFQPNSLEVVGEVLQHRQQRFRFARQDHTTYDTTSILKLIEKRFGLSSLGSRDEHAKDLSNALDFSN